MKRPSVGETGTEEEGEFGGVLIECCVSEIEVVEAIIEFFKRTHLCKFEDEDNFERAMDDRDMFCKLKVK